MSLIRYITIHGFIEKIYKYNPEIIYTGNGFLYFIVYTNTNDRMFYKTDYGMYYKTKNNFDFISKSVYPMEDFLKIINVALRKDKILKLKKK